MIFARTYSRQSTHSAKLLIMPSSCAGLMNSFRLFLFTSCGTFGGAPKAKPPEIYAKDEHWVGQWTQHTFLPRCRSCLFIIGIVECWKSAVFDGMAYCNAPSNKALILLVLLMAPLLLLNTLLWVLRWLAVMWSAGDWCVVRRSGGCCRVDSHFTFT